jgi:ornithine cyclodeaminase/alanine dehydrogenase-like protein (mu-crystallin family)
MLILTAAEVQQSLPMPQAIAAMKEAFASLHSGRAIVPPRGHLESTAQDGITLVMPARVDDLSIGDAESTSDERRAALTVKVVSVFARNPERGGSTRPFSFLIRKRGSRSRCSKARL